MIYKIFILADPVDLHFFFWPFFTTPLSIFFFQEGCTLAAIQSHREEVPADLDSSVTNARILRSAMYGFPLCYYILYN